MIYFRLFYEFAKIGLFAVGGGLATVPFLQDLSKRTGWFSTHQLADMIAVSECTPGPIGVNMATYTGFTVGGPLGSLAATLGLVFPSLVVILIVAKILAAFRDNKYVNSAFYGLRPASTGLIAAACLGVAKIALFDSGEQEFLANMLSNIRWNAVILALILWFFMNPGMFGRIGKNKVLKKIGGLHPIVFLAVAAVVGIVFQFAG